jgi:hypothetical protein
MVFWSIVGGVLVVVLLGACLYDRRHKVDIQIRGRRLEGAAEQARAEVDLHSLYNPNRPGGGGGFTPGH